MAIFSRLFVATLLSGVISVPMAVAMTAHGVAASPLAAYDTDKDGTLDLAEVKAAAGAAFDKLNKDQDTTLDRKELRGRVTAADFAAADPDKDKTLTKDEYLAMAENLFKAADADHDGTVSAAELRSKPGRALLRLMK